MVFGGKILKLFGLLKVNEFKIQKSKVKSLKNCFCICNNEFKSGVARPNYFNKIYIKKKKLFIFEQNQIYELKKYVLFLIIIR